MLPENEKETEAVLFPDNKEDIIMNRKTVKRFMAIGLSAAMALGMNATVFAADESSDSVKGSLEGVKLSFGTTALFAPFTYYDTDGTTLIGYDLDLVNALKDYLGFEIDGDIQVMDYSALTTSLAEGKLAALDMVKQFQAGTLREADIQTETEIKVQEEEILSRYEKFRNEDAPAFSVEELEEAMQKVMDEYAGGIASNYQFNEKQLDLADEKILKLQALAEKTAAADMHELMFAYELRERLIVCRSLIAHLKNRKETRWHSFNENLDHPETDEKFYKYVNSKLENGEIKIIFRDIVKEDTYEHTN